MALATSGLRGYSLEREFLRRVMWILKRSKSMSPHLG